MWIRDEDGDVHNLDGISKILVMEQDEQEDSHSIVLKALVDSEDDEQYTVLFEGKLKTCTGVVDMISTALSVGDRCLDLHHIMRQYPGQNLEEVIEKVFEKADEEKAQKLEGKN